jgi:hypothetical protein
VCMCVCVYVCMCACVHVCMCVCVYVCMCVCVYVCMCTCVHVCMCVCVIGSMLTRYIFCFAQKVFITCATVLLFIQRCSIESFSEFNLQFLSSYLTKIWPIFSWPARNEPSAFREDGPTSPVSRNPGCGQGGNAGQRWRLLQVKYFILFWIHLFREWARPPQFSLFSSLHSYDLLVKHFGVN